MFVSCVHRRVEEGKGEGIARCVVHVDVHAWSVLCCGWLHVFATEHGRHIYSVSYAETVSSDGSVWYVGSSSYVVNFIAAKCSRYGLSFMRKAVE